MPAPLDGVRVVDLSMALAAPLATHLLGHFGADVIKVESPEGDFARGAGGGSRSPGMNPFVLHTSRAKRSVVLDLKQPAGLAALLRLVAGADAFVHNLRPAAAGRLGIGYEALRNVNPGLIYCVVTGFGTGGRYAGIPAYDDVVQGASGVPWLIQQATGGDPALLPSAFSDRVTALVAYGQIATALYARRADGLGRAIEIPMFETMAHFLLSDHLYLRTFVPPMGPAGHFRLLDANRRPYRTQDGFLCVLPTHDKHWLALFDLAGRPELKADARFIDLPARMRNVRELYAFLAGALASRPTEAWLADLRRADIPAMPVNSIEDLVDDPHLADVGLMEQVEHPTEGTIVNLRYPGEWSDWRAAPGRQAPHLGEHSREILAEAGYGAGEIDALFACGATACHAPQQASAAA